MYFRHYHPVEFLTAFLNNAANDEDVRCGADYAQRNGIQITMPKWGLSKAAYFFDAEKRVVAKGLASVRYLSDKAAEDLYRIAHEKTYDRFVDVLAQIDQEKALDSRQLDILIKLDFFSAFGNQRELLYITDLFSNLFKKGHALQVRRSLVDGTPIETIVQKYAYGVTRSGGVAKSYTLCDVTSILRQSEDMVKSMNLGDLSVKDKVQNFKDAMGYAGYVSGREEDRRKLYVTDVKPLRRKKDGKLFGYSIFTKSIGSGKESRFTVFLKLFERDPIRPGEIILCKVYEPDGPYFRLIQYDKLSI